MLTSATSDVVRLMGGLVRLADGRLVRTAAMNAARSVDDARRGRQLEDLRTMRDLMKIPSARDGGLAAELSRRQA